MPFSPPAVDEIEEQPKFTPPAPDDIDVAANVKLTDYDLYKLAVSEGATPENYSELNIPASLNPDWDVVRETKGDLPGALMGKALHEVNKYVVSPIATSVLTGMKQATAPQVALMNGGRADISPVQPEVPMLTLPKLTQEEKESATPVERAVAGVGEGLAKTFESFTTPENLALLPVAGNKLVQAGFAGQMAASIPESIQAANSAKTPEEKAQALTTLAVTLGMTGALTKSIATEGGPNASRVTSPEGVSQPQVRPPVGEEAPLRQPGETAGTQKPETSARPEEVSGPLSDDNAKLLAPHMTEEGHVFAKLGDGRVMQADHESGKVVIDPDEFAAWVEHDLKGMSEKEKGEAVRSAFEHEDIHLKTAPEDAEPFWNSLSPFEQYVFKRNYLKGAMEESPRNLGFEAIRNRVERAMGLTRNDFIGMAVRERWTAQGLDALADVVGKIRRLKDKELSAHQKSILDKVIGNIDAARTAVSTMVDTPEEGLDAPFMRRQTQPAEPEEGMVRLWRGHDGNNGGVYWSKDQTYASRMGSKLEYLDVPADQVGDFAVRKTEGSGTPNAFKLPSDWTKDAQPYEGAAETPVHNLDDIESELPPTAPGERVVLVKRPDGSLYRAAYAGKQYDVSAGGKTMIDKYGGSMVDSIGTVNERGQWTHGLLPKGHKIIKGFSPYAAVERSGEEGPAMRRKEKPGEQPEMFGAITQKGVPGGEDVQPISAQQAGATEFPPEQKIFPKDMAFEPKQYGAKSLPFRQITASEAKSGAELSKFLTADARKEGSDLPVSMTKRLTALFDKRDGSVHLVSTYAGDGIARMVDPALAGKERPNRPIDEILPNYEPIASILLAEPKQNFHQKFNSMADFQTMFADEARDLAREHSTGTEGIPQTRVSQTPARDPEAAAGRSVHPSEPFRFPKEQREPNFPRPTTEELKSFHDFFGDTPPSDALMFSRRVESGAATATRTMINGLRKLVRIERGQTRGLSEGEAIGRVLDKLYENFTNSETRSDFVQKTLAQSNFGAPEEIPAGGAPRQTGARELTHLRDVAPTTDRNITLPKGGEPVVPKMSFERQKMLSPEEREEVNRQVRLQTVEGSPTARLSPTIYSQLAHREVPKERYKIAGTKSIQEGVPSLEERPPEPQSELFPTREMETEGPNAPEPTEELAAEKKVVAKGEGNKGQLDFFQKKGGPAMRRRAEELLGKVKDYLARTGEAVSTAGDLSDQLYRLKTGEKADYDLALPVIKSAIRMIAEDDRPTLLRYADEMQVLKKSSIKLDDNQQMLYDTFLKPLIDDNQKMYKDLMRAGVPVGESTYLGRVVQDTHSLYSRLWRGTKQRIVEGSILGQGASFFKRRVFKALEDNSGDRRLIALVGDGKNTRVIAYEKGKADLMGKMPPESLEVKPLTPQQVRTQRLVEARRLQELDKLDKEEAALLKEKAALAKDPNADPVRVKGVEDRLASINGDYADVAEKYPGPVFDVPRMWRDKNGKVWRLTDATVGEIETHTNTRYYKEPMSGIITQNLKLKQIYRANKFIEDLKNSPDFQRLSRGINERNVPEDWRTVDIPQLRGLRIEPRAADVLDLFSQEQAGPSLPFKYINQLGQFLRNALFVWNPFVHEPNLLAHWFTARGVEWAKPVGYDRMFKSGVAALTDVMTRSRFRDQALRQGAPLMRGMGKINQEVLGLLRKELEPNPALSTKIARGLGYVNPLRMIRAFGDSLTWGTNEILTLQLIRETMDRTGLPMADAISEVGKHMPNYRVPPRVLNSRLISQVMRNPMLSLWGHYHYGALRSYGEMAKEIVSPRSTMEQRIEGLGRVATIGFLMALVYPTIDDIVNKILKTKGLKMRRAGSTTAPSNIIDLLQGKKTPEAVAQSIVTPAPVPIGAAELAFNRNLRNGLPIYERRLGMDTLKDLGNFAAQKISPVEEYSRVAGGKKSGQEFGLGLAGIARTRVDSAMSRFGRMADDWMRKNPDEGIREDYKRRTQDVFQESDYQLLRSAVIRQDARAQQMAVEKLLRTRKPEEVARRIKQWKDSPFTGTRKTERALISELPPEGLDLWYQAAQERLDIANGMVNALADAVMKKK